MLDSILANIADNVGRQIADQKMKYRAPVMQAMIAFADAGGLEKFPNVKFQPFFITDDNECRQTTKMYTNFAEAYVSLMKELSNYKDNSVLFIDMILHF